MLSSKDNYFAVLHHEKPDYVPDSFLDCNLMGGAFETFENGPLGGGEDGFGLRWLCTKSANGQGVPDPACHPVPEITEWKKYLKLPDLSAYDWEGEAKRQGVMADRDHKFTIYGCWNSMFLRFCHLLGFGEALCAIAEEPEASYEMMDAIADYKCRQVEYIVKYFKPDMITSYIDVCTENGPFLSLPAYKKIISPLQKKVNDCIRSFDVYPSVHNCGKCDELIPSFIEEGYVQWESAQPINDIVSIQKNYGDRIVVVGGYNTNGRPGRMEVTDDEIKAEVRRMMDTYAPNGSYVSMGFLLTDDEDPMAFINNMAKISSYVNELRFNYY